MRIAQPVRILGHAWRREAVRCFSSSPVGIIGDLRQIKTNELKGDGTRLSDIVARSPHTYGIGMLDGMVGEVFIKNSTALNGWFDGMQYRLEEIAPDETVCFLAYAQVPEWRAVRVPGRVRTFADLEAFIGEAAAEAGFDPAGGEAVPVRLEAYANTLKWFIVNGEGNGAPDHLQSFFRQRVLGGLDDVEIDAVGLYSPAHKGIASNPNTALHMHFITESTKEPFVGHLDDDLEIRSGSATVFFPAS